MTVRTRSLAVVAAAAALTLVVAQPAWSRRSHGTNTHPVIELSRVAQRELAQPTSNAGAPGGTVLRVTIPDGTLELVGAPTSVVLDRRGHSDSFRAVLTDLRVIDTSAGNHGWELLVHSDGRSSTARRLTVGVTRVVATSATTAGLGAQAHVDVRGNRSHPLAWALPRTGNGSFAITLVVDAVVPSARGARVAIPLELALV